MIKYFAAALAVIALCSCDSNSDGPCEWYESPFYAKVEKIEFLELNDQGDSLFTIWVDFSAGTLSDELQDLGKLKGIDFTREKIVQNKAQVGLSYTGTINDIKSGSCESPMVSFDQKIE